MGYHIAQIEPGVLGESSKILEEVLELQDAEQQDAKIMALCELADIIGAVSLYLQKHYPDMTMKDLHKMAALTASAFKDGTRK